MIFSRGLNIISEGRLYLEDRGRFRWKWSLPFLLLDINTNVQVYDDIKDELKWTKRQETSIMNTLPVKCPSVGLTVLLRVSQSVLLLKIWPLVDFRLLGEVFLYITVGHSLVSDLWEVRGIESCCHWRVFPPLRCLCAPLDHLQGDFRLAAAKHATFTCS